MNPDALTDFHKVEYKSLRKEIEAPVKEERELERYSLVATAAVWTLLATKGKHGVDPIFYWIPAALVLMAIVRSIALLLAIRKIAAYIRTFESVLPTRPPNGCETFFHEPRDQWIRICGAFFWFCLLIVTCIAPSLMQH